MIDQVGWLTLMSIPPKGFAPGVDVGKEALASTKNAVKVRQILPLLDVAQVPVLYYIKML